MAFPITGPGDIVVMLEEGGILAECPIDFRFAPDIELAFFAFAIRIESAGESAETIRRRSCAHLAQQPADSFANALLVERSGGVLPAMGHHLEECCVVVKHLLEM